MFTLCEKLTSDPQYFGPVLLHPGEFRLIEASYFPPPGEGGGGDEF